jgi:hypothetical protein
MAGVPLVPGDSIPSLSQLQVPPPEMPPCAADVAASFEAERLSPAPLQHKVKGEKKKGKKGKAKNKVKRSLKSTFKAHHGKKGATSATASSSSAKKPATSATASSSSAEQPHALATHGEYDLSHLPEDARPTKKTHGKHSYTIASVSGAKVEVLLRNQAFYVKQLGASVASEKMATQHFSWVKSDGPHGSWDEIKKTIGW